ncbi:MAG: hypothetical protein AAGD01_20340 [Acidobacteriota bacterium]
MSSTLLRRPYRLLLAFLLASIVLPACANPNGPGITEPGEAFISQKEVVKVTVDRRTGSIEVDEPVVTIYLQHDRERFEKQRPVEVQWLVDGLPRGWRLYVVAAEGSRSDVFKMPDTYEPRWGKESDGQEKPRQAASDKRGGGEAAPAFLIDNPNNALRSGTVQRFPKEQRKPKGDLSKEDLRERFEGDKKLRTAFWSYDLVLVDRRGREVGRLDPDVRILMYP